MHEDLFAKMDAAVQGLREESLALHAERAAERERKRWAYAKRKGLISRAGRLKLHTVTHSGRLSGHFNV